MNFRAAFGSVVCVSALACGLCSVSTRAQDRQEIVKVNGSPRTIQVHLPEGYSKTKRYPVVLALHGIGGDASFMARISHFNQTADKFGFIVVYPNAREGRWTAPRGAETRSIGGFGRRRTILDDITRTPSADDVGGMPVNDMAFFHDLLDQIESEYSVDTSRIFATGYSDGAFMDFRLGCEMADRIAAIATVGALLPGNLADTCTDWSWRAVPLLMMNGTDDPAVPYKGRLSYNVGYYLLPARDTLKQWAKINSCSQKPERSTIPPKSSDGLETRVDTYTDCKDGATAVLYSIEKGGHTWPGGEQAAPVKYIGKTNADLDASEVIWKFFAAHPMPPRK